MDLIKVLLQTKGETKGNVLRTTIHVVKENGVRSLWNGISASILRQLTYSTTRFAIYDLVKHELIASGYEMRPSISIALAGVAGKSNLLLLLIAIFILFFSNFLILN